MENKNNFIIFANMKGKNYFNWLSDYEKSQWKENFNKGHWQTFDEFLDREFPGWPQFIILSFDLYKSNEGKKYWYHIIRKYRNYDNITVKPEFNFFRKQPKVFK